MEFVAIKRHAAMGLFGVLAMAGSMAAQAGWQQPTTLAGMTVHMYVPDSYSPVGDGRAAMVILHGCSQQASAFQAGGNLESVAEEYGMIMAIPNVPGGGVVAGCWDYYGSDQGRTKKHSKNVIELGQILAARADVDANQIYVAGLSSGATQAQVVGCLAPELFKGVGSVSGPTMGTASGDAFSFPRGSAAQAAQLCRQWAGSNVALLKKQVWNIAHGTADSLVPYGYAGQNIRAVGILKEIGKRSDSTELGATVELWGDSDPSRLEATFLSNTGMDHDWPAGGDSGGGQWIDNTTRFRNYADYLAGLFAAHNPWINPAPVVSSLQLSAVGSVIAAQASISDENGYVASAAAKVYDPLNDQDKGAFALQSSGGGNLFTGQSPSLANGVYLVTVTGTDNHGVISAPVAKAVVTGPAPAPAAPLIRGVEASANGQCATVSGRVVDVNLADTVTVTVAFANGSMNAAVSNFRFSATKCDLPGGTNTATVTARDNTNRASSASVGFGIDPGITATLSEHINAGRLDYTAYSTCYLEYSTDAFKLAKQSVGGGQCSWSDADGSCAGPQAPCDGPPPVDECEDVTATNSAHAAGGRATLKYSVLYYANGSNAYLGTGSTSTTLNSEDGSHWKLGACPN